MQIFLGFIIIIAFLLLFAYAIKWRKKAVSKVYDQMKEKPHSYTLIVSTAGEIPVSDSIIINLDNAAQNFTPEDFEPKMFNINVSLKDYYTTREVLSAHPCDIDGNKLNFEDGFTHILLELKTLDKEELSLLNPVEKDLYLISHKKFNGNILVANDCIYQSNSPYSQPK